MRPIAPTSVSFYRVFTWEVGCVATNATGYFTNTNVFSPDNLDHGKAGAGDWYPLGIDNDMIDETGGGPNQPLPGPTWAPGGHYTWPIPVAWQVGTNTHYTNCPIGWNQDQDFWIDSAGTQTVKKFGISSTRTTNNVITITNNSRIH
jgi:hypothetical protein